LKYYYIAVQHGDHIAAKHLGTLYKKGKGCEKNYNIAARHFAAYCKVANENINDHIDLVEHNVMWELYLHKWWNRNLDGNIMMILLICKKYNVDVIDSENIIKYIMV